MPVAAMLARAVHQPLDLPLSEVAPFDCQVYDGWCAFLGCRFHADKPCLRGTDCLAYKPFLNSQFDQRPPWHRCPCDHTGHRPMEEYRVVGSIRSALP